MTAIEQPHRPGRLRRIAAIAANDFRAFSRERFIFIIGLLAIIMYAAIYWILPANVDETIKIGIFQADGALPLAALSDQGLELVPFDSEQALQQAVETGEGVIVAGIVLPADLFQALIAPLGAGPTPLPTIVIYTGANTAPELVEFTEQWVRELTYAAVGRQLAVEMPEQREVIVGVDRAGAQISAREKARPLAAIFVLGIEMMGIALLIAKELGHRTVTALMTTPATVTDFILAKVSFGASLAFLQAFALIALIGGLNVAPLQITLFMILGAFLFTGLALIAGERSREFVDILFWMIIFLIPALIPTVTVMLPGAASAWVRAIPSWPLAQGIFEAANGASWGELLPELGLTAAWVVAILAAGIFLLRRTVARL